MSVSASRTVSIRSLVTSVLSWSSVRAGSIPRERYTSIAIERYCPRHGGRLAMIDPLERWKQYGEKPDYAGLLTFSGMPYTQDATELAGVDVAIVGAPTDDLVSDRPGTRFGPRAIRAAGCPPGAHLEAGIDGFKEL